MIKRMPAHATTICPGCGLHLPGIDAELPVRFNASAECFQHFTDLSARTLSLGDPYFCHQHAVDAYGAQHGNNMKPMMLNFALIGLYLFVVCGASGRDVQAAHAKLANMSIDWRRLTPPSDAGHQTVNNVAITSDRENLQLAIADWATSCWQAWSTEHTYIAQLCERYLHVQRL